MNYRYRLVAACAALAVGEGVAALIPTYFESWPLVAVIAVLAAVFGYACAVRGWPFLVVALLGMTIFFLASLESERTLREAPWMRGVRRHRMAEAAKTPFADLKRDFSRRVSLGIGSNRDLVQLNRAILLGERAHLPRRLKRTFEAAGTIHVFAISGLHVMAVARVLMLILRLLFVPRRFVGTAALPILWGYVVLIGAPPSSVRAAMMLSFYCLGPIFWRKPDGLVAWSLTFLAVHLADPSMIANVGCQLSFAVMLAILLSCDWLRDEPEGLRKTFLVSLSAWAAGVPIVAHSFGLVTPGALLANLVLIPAAAITVYAGALGLLVSFVSETLAAHLNNLSALFTQAMVIVSDGISRLPGAHFEVVRWSGAMCGAWVVAMGLVGVVVFLVRKRRGWV